MKCLKCDGELHPIIKNGQSYAQCDKCGSLFTRHDLKYHTQTPQPQNSQPVAAEPDDDDGYYTMGLPTAILGWILCALFLMFGLASQSAIPLIAFIVAAVLISPVFRNRIRLSGKIWIPLVVVLAVAGLATYPQLDTQPKKIAQKQDAPTPAPKQIKASTKKQDKEDTEEQQAAKEREEAERAAKEQAEREEQERIAQEQAEQERIAQEQAAAQAEQERIAQEAAQAEQERIAQEQAAAQAEQQRIAQEQAAAQQAEQERIAREQAEQQRIAQEQAAIQAANTVPQPPAEGMVWLTETGDKYHNTNNCGNTKSAAAYQVPLSQAQQMGKEPCKKCYN